jgi:hypothetical protein
MKGVDLRPVQELLGHKTITMTLALLAPVADSPARGRAAIGLTANGAGQEHRQRLPIRCDARP